MSAKGRTKRVAYTVPPEITAGRATFYTSVEQGPSGMLQTVPVMILQFMVQYDGKTDFRMETNHDHP